MPSSFKTLICFELALCCALLTLLQSCSTISNTKNKALPASLSPFFSVCAPSDGAYAIQAFRDDELLGSAELEWLAKRTNSWDIELSNQAGQRLAKLKLRNQQIVISGSLLKNTGQITVNPSGFLMIDDHLTGIKASEIPCILVGKAPTLWQANVTEFSLAKNQAEITFSQDSRDMEIVSEPKDKSLTLSFCTRIKWTEFLIFNHQVAWCLRQGAHSEIEINALDHYRIRLVNIASQPITKPANHTNYKNRKKVLNL